MAQSRDDDRSPTDHDDSNRAGSPAASCSAVIPGRSGRQVRPGRCGLPSGGPVVWLATGLGVGYVRIAPGTFGTLWGLPLVGVLSQLSLHWYLAISAALIVASVPLCYLAAGRLGAKDPSAVVLDEIASFPLVFVGVRVWGDDGIRWPLLAAGFVLHRVFDIAKPPPVRQLERLPGGWGIVADDLVAAAYAWLGVLGASPWFP